MPTSSRIRIAGAIIKYLKLRSEKLETLSIQPSEAMVIWVWSAMMLKRFGGGLLVEAPPSEEVIEDYG